MHSQLAIQALLVIVGLINFLPVAGIVSATALSRAYDIDISDSNLEILMRHRALLFGVLGGFILASVFLPAYQGAAMLMAGIAMIAFLALMLSVGDYNSALLKVAWADGVGLLCLFIAAVLKVVSAPQVLAH